MEMFDHSQIDFTVKKTPLFYDNQAYSPSFGDRMVGLSYGIGMLLKREDTNEPIAVVSEGYEVVQYRDIVEGVEEALTLSGLDMTDAEFQTNVFNNGSQLELRAKFPAHALTVDKGDKVVPTLVGRTSHDGTWANNFMMGAWRNFCWNLLVSGSKYAYMYGKHTKGFNVVSFAQKVRNAGEYISGEGLQEMQGWYNKDVSRGQVINLFSNTLAKHRDNVSRKNKPNQVMLSNLMKVWDEENRHIHGRSHYEKYAQRTTGSLWTAYNAATYWSSHVKPRKDSSPHNVMVTREDKVRKMLHSPEWLALAA